MDAAAPFPLHQVTSRVDVSTPAQSRDTNRTLTVTATYLLSEEGRKALLLAGGDGRALQELPIQVPAHRLHLVSVDIDGVARLKLRPRYQVDHAGAVTLIDTAPTYNAPPDLEELFRDAARNHELEATFYAARKVSRASRRNTEQERLAQIAQAFLGDPSQRALVHPPPTEAQCVLLTPDGRVRFDAQSDDALARQVPPEAYRRFRVDSRERQERNRPIRAAQEALHEIKQRFVGEWIAAHGTEEQQARQAAGMLPFLEGIEIITNHALAAVGERPLYVNIGAPDLQGHLRQFPEYAHVTLTPADVRIVGANAAGATSAQWALMNEFKTLLPLASVLLREYTVAWKRDTKAPTLKALALLVTCSVGPLACRRFYAIA